MTNGEILSLIQGLEILTGLKVHFLVEKEKIKMHYIKILTLFSAPLQCGTGNDFSDTYPLRWNFKGEFEYSTRKHSKFAPYPSLPHFLLRVPT